jgi:hypothetical protein
LLAGVAVAALALAVHAQAAGEELDRVFTDLRQLQDANLAVAREMSDIERRAAAVLEAAAAEIGAADPERREVVDALVFNALTLAAVALAPGATDEAANRAFSDLLERNLAVLNVSAPLLAAPPGLAAAIEQYAAMQARRGN